MPRLHKYRERNVCYVLTAIRGNVITYQLTPEQASVLTFYTFQQRSAVEATTACGYQPALGAALC
jgi:hypothetical protein